MYSGECNACSLKLFELLLFAIWLFPSAKLLPVSLIWLNGLSIWWFFFDDVIGIEGEHDDDNDVAECWPLWLLHILLLLLLLLLFPLCVSVVEGDDVGRFELCIELFSEFL